MRGWLPAGAAGVAVALMLAASAEFVLRWRRTPQDCAYVAVGPAGEVRVDAADTGCPLRPGDLVTAADGLGGAELAVSVVRDEATRIVPVPLATPDLAATLAPVGPTLLVMGGLFALALYLIVRRPAEPASATLLLGTGGLFASTVTWGLGLSVTGLTDPSLRWGSPVGNQLVYVLGWTGILAFALVFPRRLLSPWLTWLVAATPLLVLLATAGIAAVTAPDQVAWVGVLIACGLVVTVAVLLTTLGIAVYRLVTTTDPVGRQQLRWVAGGAALSAGLGLAGWYLPELLLGDFVLPPELMGLGALPVMAGLAVAVLRYRLFDMDVVLNRSLVYGGLVIVVTTLYLFVVAGLTQVVEAGPLPGTAVIGTVAVAVAVNPLRIALQRGINRMMYGDRDDPYAALSRLSQRLEATAAQQTVLAEAAGEVRRALRLPFAQIALADGTTAAAGARPGAGELTELPLRHAGEQVGVLRVAPRVPSEPLSRADLRLLRDLAHQVTGAAQVIRLHADLQRSRERLVLAREEERRRLRRVLHDEIGPSVAALGLWAASATRRPDPEGLRRIQTEASATAAQLRRLAYDLRPPVLDERGLLGAVQDLPAGDGLALTVSTEGEPDGLVGLPAAVEVAAYRIVAEALANVRRHAAARSCTVRLHRSATALELEVRDDGGGLPPGFRAGVGVASMRERAAELGGECTVSAADGAGTVVRALLPIAGGTQ